MSKINQEEYEVLKGLDDKWKWIARDLEGEMYTFVIKPHKNDRFNDWRNHECDWIRFENSLFHFIQWEDEEPHNIAELIEDFEEAVRVNKIFENSTKMALKESEGTEVKTLESIREEIWEEMLRIEDKRLDQWADIKYQTLREVLQKLGHLDEPEVLSQEWIDDNSVYASFDGLTGEYVHVDDLQNLLVPKQELPVIPNYVAKWISVHHEQFDLYPALKRLENNALSWEDVYEWYRKNTRKFVSAYLTGKYEVEEEQKYYVLDTEDIPMLVRTHGVVNRANTHLSIHEKGRNTEHYQLTEQEIKDYDERYFAFAVKVEELEE